ncbi:MAG: META domain-containing protein [Prevotellaceae bacterium]|jgi:heat shock protein HslJ|nr:META domain-containing protein [Prevotellaceae bacterium]
MMRFIFLTILFLLAVACGTTKHDALLFDVRWHVEQIDGAAVDSTGENAYIVWKSGDEHTVSGNTSCNPFSGKFMLDKDRLTFSDMAVTRRACFGENIEQAFLAILARTTRYRIADGKLILTDDANDIAVLHR